MAIVFGKRHLLRVEGFQVKSIAWLSWCDVRREEEGGKEGRRR
jgi:hypothetical protein